MVAGVLYIRWASIGLLEKEVILMRMFIAGLVVTVLFLATYFVRHMENIW